MQERSDDTELLMPGLLTIPARDRLLNHFADMLLDIDAVLELLRSEAGSRFRSLEPRAHSLYGTVNDLIKQLGN